MPASAFLLAFAAAWIHGTSNVFLGRRREPEAAFAVMLVAGVVAFAPIAALSWDVDAAAVPYIAASAALELGYFAFLAAAYRASEVSLVYPVARGIAPVLVLLGAVVFLHHGTSPGQAAGVLAVAVGILLVRGVGAMAARGDANGFLLALASSIFIAGYTLVDKQGLAHAAPIPYIELVLIGPAVVYTLAVWRLRGQSALRQEATLGIGLVGIVLLGTYVLVLLALRLAPAASVSAVRETSVVIASGVAALAAREHVTRSRFAGAVLVTAGIALVALSCSELHPAKTGTHAHRALARESTTSTRPEAATRRRRTPASTAEHERPRTGTGRPQSATTARSRCDSSAAVKSRCVAAASSGVAQWNGWRISPRPCASSSRNAAHI
jgi:drug/metabolite transporter (DMT)-like permease